jgi:hypothetical protein
MRKAKSVEVVEYDLRYVRKFVGSIFSDGKVIYRHTFDRFFITLFIILAVFSITVGVVQFYHKKRAKSFD